MVLAERGETACVHAGEDGHGGRCAEDVHRDEDDGR